MPSRPRALILALDGATFDLIGPWIEAGRLPNLARLVREGAHGRLRSTQPPITPCAWTSFSTAQNPGWHGIFDFQQFVPGTYDLAPTNGALRRTGTVWEYLNRCGLSVGLYNLPWMYPPPPLDGYCVCGFDAPDINPKAVHPPELSRELHAAVPGLSLAAEFLKKRGGTYDLEALRRQVRVNVEAARFLLRERPVDVCLLTFMLLDQVAHFFYYVDPAARGCGEVADVLLAVHEWVDEGLREILTLVPPECAVIGVSDHGVAPTTLHVNVARALADARLLVYGGRLGSGARSQDPGERPRRTAGGGAARLKRVLSAVLPSSVWLKLRRARHARRSRERFAAVDWSRTKAFSWGNFAQVRLNLVGREPQGIVRPEEREAVIAEVKQVLLGLRDPATGEALFQAALTPEELYKGSHTEGAADVLGIPVHSGIDASLHLATPDAPLIVTRDAALAASPEMAEKVAGHDPEGIFFACGGPFLGGATVTEAGICDVLPTLLRALDVELPPGLDGAPIEGALTPEFLAAHPGRYAEQGLAEGATGGGESYSDDDRDAVESRLRDLGYMG
jgi:predicted AlkP superfamily phosphohydrolase/phosphomutase